MGDLRIPTTSSAFARAARAKKLLACAGCEASTGGEPTTVCGVRFALPSRHSEAESNSRRSHERGHEGAELRASPLVASARSSAAEASGVCSEGMTPWRTSASSRPLSFNSRVSLCSYSASAVSDTPSVSASTARACPRPRARPQQAGARASRLGLGAAGPRVTGAGIAAEALLVGVRASGVLMFSSPYPSTGAKLPHGTPRCARLGNVRAAGAAAAYGKRHDARADHAARGAVVRARAASGHAHVAARRRRARAAGRRLRAAAPGFPPDGRRGRQRALALSQ